MNASCITLEQHADVFRVGDQLAGFLALAVADPPVFWRRNFSPSRKGARLARLLALYELDAWGFPYGSELSDAVAAIVAELAANAVTHGCVPGRDLELRVVLTAGQAIRIEVSDARDERRPPARLAAPEPDAEAGAGPAGGGRLGEPLGRRGP